MTEIEFYAAVSGQIVGLLAWSFLNAAMLQWRARALENWNIRYRTAYFVSLKAGLIGTGFAWATALAVVFAGIGSTNPLGQLATGLGMAAWWFAHSNALIKLAARNSIPLTVEEARAISTSVIGYLLVALLPLLIALVIGLKVLGVI